MPRTSAVDASDGINTSVLASDLHLCIDTVYMPLVLARVFVAFKKQRLLSPSNARVE